MNLGYFAGAAFRAFTTKRNGPTLYDLCDPLLRGSGPGDAHLRKFYQTALANPALRPLLARAGLPQLADPARFRAWQDALIAARDEATPDWRTIGAPLAAVLDQFPQTHPKPPPAPEADRAPPSRAEIDRIIRACAAHLMRSYARNGFIPAYAAFNLIGDPDLRGRDLLHALDGLDARTYKNSTLLFNLARVFLLANPHVAAVLNPPWHGIAEPMWEPVQIRHRSAYYDAFYAEALMDYLGSSLATADETAAARDALTQMIAFCLTTSREEVRASDGRAFNVVTALAPPPHARLSKFFQQVKSDLGFGLYVPDCDTTACSVSAATQFGAQDPLLDQPLIDFYAGYQSGHNNRHGVTVAINDNIDYAGGILTWIENLAGDRPYGNDLDPTLNLDVLEATFRNHARWQVVENPQRLETVRRIVAFLRRLVASGAFADPRAHIYYLPELFAAYFGRCHATFRTLPAATQQTIDPDGSFAFMRTRVLAYVRDELIARAMNPFDAALALLALAKLEAEPQTFARPLAVIARSFGEGWRAPYKAYEWNKMKTPTRILVGGPEVTSAFVLSALTHARGTLP